MRKNSFIFMVLFLSTTLVVAQSKLEMGFYCNLGFAYNYKYQLNDILTDLGTMKVSPITAGGSFGVHFDYRNVVYSLDLGIGSGMANKQTRLLNLSTNLSIGYQLLLARKNSLIFSGTLSYGGDNVSSYITKGNLDMETATLTTSHFNAYLHRFMAGAKITWFNDGWGFGMGYDVGIVPTKWKSDVVNISNNIKERVDRIHVDITYDIRKY